jgi:hypothetical protein
MFKQSSLHASVVGKSYGLFFIPKRSMTENRYAMGLT